MLKQLFKQKWYMFSILALIIAEPSLASVLNFWLQRIFNSAVPGANKIVVLRLLTMGFLLWILKRVMSYASGVLKNRFICNAKQEVKHKLFTNLMGLNTANISRIASSGEYISIFTNDITLLEIRFYEQVINLIGSVFAIVILGTSFLALNLKLALAIIAFGVLSLIVPMVFSKRLNEKNLIYSSSISKFTQKMKEYMMAYPTIKNYSIEDTIAQKFNEINHDTEETKFETDCTLTLANNVGQLLAWFMQFIGVGFGIILVIKGEILIGTVIAAQAFANDLGNPLQGTIVSINSIRSVKEIVKKLERLSTDNKSGDAAEKSDEAPESSDDGDEKCVMSYENFSLKFGDAAIIKNFSFVFEPGKKYLVVGLNGSGKSTLFKTLKKWYTPTEGTIRINGTDILALDSQEIGKTVSYLNENVSLFSGSVKENISLFREFSSDTLDRAVSGAQVKIDLDRVVSDDGRNISSGEQRRIEIARSLLESVKVFIFDEVVSTLDIETAYEIEKMALGLEGKTVIFISHNFSGKLIRQYDEILVMENGSLLAHGNFEELIDSCEYFKRICDIKFG